MRRSWTRVRLLRWLFLIVCLVFMPGLDAVDGTAATPEASLSEPQAAGEGNGVVAQTAAAILGLATPVPASCGAASDFRTSPAFPCRR